MKTIIITLAAIGSLTLASCKKCYTCSNSKGSKDFCKGSVEYETLKKGFNVTDEQGQGYKCI